VTTKFQAKRGNRQDDYLHTHGSQVIVLSVTSFLAYGVLATYVTRHAMAVDGPLHERYLVGPHDTSDTSAWRTEIGWPIFHTG
jgi:hypothetical protein